MVQQEFCKDCYHKHDCQQVYRQLGHSTCPSVLRKVIVAFLLPLLVFIVSLVVLDRFFAAADWNILHSAQNGIPGHIQAVKTFICFLLALLITCVCVVLMRVIVKRLGNNF
ncbi:MAG: hypothetical protein JW715_03355 [Sedimentisphaerales bacterium]|nr:hypothetical protein [Sedimentisphaerales bacterium]